jgi:hypothetical protein
MFQKFDYGFIRDLIFRSNLSSKHYVFNGEHILASTPYHFSTTPAVLSINIEEVGFQIARTYGVEVLVFVGPYDVMTTPG